MAGKSNAEIGRELFVSGTRSRPARRLFRKLRARDRAHAVAVGSGRAHWPDRRPVLQVIAGVTGGPAAHGPMRSLVNVSCTPSQ